ELHDKLSAAGAELLLYTLPKLADHSLRSTPQNHDEATFAANIKREQEKIDWNNSNDVIYNQIRGLNPWPVAFTFHHHKPMKIWWGVTDNRLYDGAPGEIVQVGSDHFTVVCGDGQAIQISDIQPAGKKRMTVEEYLRGSADRLKIGMTLGDEPHA